MEQEIQKFIPKVTFLVKEPTDCPVCESRFYKESLLTGGGRLNADKVSETLHRLYKPMQKFGKIFPLIYSIYVCPECFYTCLPGDFLNAPKDKVNEILKAKSDRIDLADKLIGEKMDYNKYRTLESGAAAYALAVQCYDYFPRKSIPVIKQAICSIRSAYLFEDLDKEKPGENYNFLSELFYKKALFFYKRALELNQNQEQVLENMKNLGPDIDKNYGYDGVIYLIGILAYKYGIKNDSVIRKKELEEGRLYLGKLFGMGKTDFDKPKEILEKSKQFHEIISKEIKVIDENS